MIVDILYTAHNRLEFTKASLAMLIENTDWDLVDRLYILDDNSVDWTSEHLALEADKIALGEINIDVPVELHRRPFGGPVAAMNHYLDASSARPVQAFAKIDSDVIVSPGWLETMLGVFNRHTELDALGMEPGFAKPVPTKTESYSYTPARWIGGVGLYRKRAFEHRRPKPVDRWFGLTQFQRDHMLTGWIDPDLPVFLLDHLPFEPWRSLAVEYVGKGWQRQWDIYPPKLEPYWAWWRERTTDRRLKDVATKARECAS